MTLIIFGVKLLLGAMKASRQQAGENRARVLRVAARRFREGGIAGVSVADVMHEAARVLQAVRLEAGPHRPGLRWVFPKTWRHTSNWGQGVDGTRLKGLLRECLSGDAP
jgi:hypothetical protein